VKILQERYLTIYKDDAIYALLHEQINQKLSTFFIACGRDDFLFRGPEKMDSLLTDLGIKHSFYATEGGHTIQL